MDMVEKIARVLAIEDGMHPEAVSNDEDQVPVWKLYQDGARAALEAMREPTQEMVVAGEDAVSRGSATGYTTMIDAALSPSSPPTS